MNIKLQEVTVGDVYDGYLNSDELGVTGYNNKLNIRPKYQREFIYKDKERDEVIYSVYGVYPLGIMYWAITGENTYEVLDGQQRTLSLMEYVDGNFSVLIDGKPRTFDNLTDKEKEDILNYKLMVYICDGEEAEKLNWFKIVNIVGQPLKDQEIRNSVYAGPWLNEAKKYFSKTGGPAKQVGGDYMTGTANRQDYLETALKWISKRNGESIEDYMSKHQHDTNANELWLYFQSVINWVESTFRNYRKEMKNVDWGGLYNTYKDQPLDPLKLEEEISRLMEDDDVSKMSGIYDYVLTGNESSLNIRKFSNSMKRSAYERQKGICPRCGIHYELDEMEADHITPWSEGGKTIADNCQMLCKNCNRRKSNK